MGKPKADELEFWVVVCTDLHLSIGPFSSPEVALRVAKRLSQAGQCVFIPIPFVLQGEVVEVEKIAQRHSKKRVYEPRGYL